MVSLPMQFNTARNTVFFWVPEPSARAAVRRRWQLSAMFKPPDANDVEGMNAKG
jgi:hypothetical protein